MLMNFTAHIDFNIFNVEGWVRCRRKILAEFPELDMRTEKTKECEEIVKSEVA